MGIFNSFKSSLAKSNPFAKMDYSEGPEGKPEGFFSFDKEAFASHLGESLGQNMGTLGGMAGKGLGSMINSDGFQTGAGNMLGAASDLAANIPGPYGAIGSAALGLSSGIVNKIFGSSKDEQKYQEYQSEINRLNNTKGDYQSLDEITGLQGANVTGDVYKGRGASSKNWALRNELAKAEENALNIKRENIDDIMDNQRQSLLANYAAFGGPLHSNGADWDNGVKYINSGGSHEMNSYGGVPVDIAPDGMPDLVEEGEVIFDNYVFSNRLRLPKDLMKKYKLGKKKNMTFADAAKKLSKESEERPNDPISKRGVTASLGRLQDDQEMYKAKKELKKAVDNIENTQDPQYIQEIAASLNGNNAVQPEEEIPQDMQDPNMIDPSMMQQQQFASGGSIHIDPSKKGTFTAAAKKHGLGVQEFASRVLANPDNYSSTMVKKANFARNASKWNHKHADRYSFLNPNNLYESYFNYNIRPSTMEDITGRLDPAHEVVPRAPFSYEYYNTPSTIVLINGEQRNLADVNNETSSNIPNLFQPFGGNTPVIGKGVYIPPTNIPTEQDIYNLQLLSTPITPKENKVKNSKTISRVSKNTSSKNPPTVDIPAEEIPLAGEIARNQLMNLSTILPDEKAVIKSPKLPTRDEILNDPEELERLRQRQKERERDEREQYSSGLGYLRRAPVVGSVLSTFSDALGLTNTPDYSYSHRIENAGERAANNIRDISARQLTNRLTYNPFDRAYYANQLAAQQAANRRILSNNALGNRAAATANLLAADYKNNIVLGDLYRKGQEYNEARRKEVEDFNRATDQANIANTLTAQQANQQADQQRAKLLYDAYINAVNSRKMENAAAEQARAINLSNMYINLGRLGREDYDLNMLNNLAYLYYGFDPKTGKQYKKTDKDKKTDKVDDKR